MKKSSQTSFNVANSLNNLFNPVQKIFISEGIIKKIPLIFQNLKEHFLSGSYQDR